MVKFKKGDRVRLIGGWLCGTRGAVVKKLKNCDIYFVQPIGNSPLIFVKDLDLEFDTVPKLEELYGNN
jgi:ribosomal protein L24